MTLTATTFTLALWLTSIPPTSGQTAILRFENLYSISFPGDDMGKFLQCLCDNSKKACKYNYQLVTVQRYVTADDPISEDTTDGDPSGEPFLCHPGRFSPDDSVSCVRSSDTSTYCEDQAFCQPVYVATTGYVTCDVSCVSMGWIATSISGLNFTGNPEFEDGFCPTDLDATETEDTSITSDDLPQSSDSVGALEIATIVGVFFLVLVVVIIVTYLLCRKCSVRKQEEPTPPVPPNTSNLTVPPNTSIIPVPPNTSIIPVPQFSNKLPSIKTPPRKEVGAKVQNQPTGKKKNGHNNTKYIENPSEASTSGVATERPRQSNSDLMGRETSQGEEDRLTEVSV